MARRSIDASVSLGGAAIEDGLPFPVAHYPRHYGTFIGYSEQPDSPVFLCSCMQDAVEHLVELGRRYRSSELERWSEISIGPTGWRAEDHKPTDFLDELCHRCNLQQPSLLYCHQMYGGKFKQTYGWYINQAWLRLGIFPNSHLVLAEVCPPELRELVEEARRVEQDHFDERTRLMTMAQGPSRDDIPSDDSTFWRNVRNSEAETFVRLRRRAGALKRKLSNRIENLTRQEFGFRKVGEGWVSETLLYQIVERLFPAEHIVRHHRPSWLGGLELDIYLPRLDLAFEYQGQQHFHPVEAWGGEQALAEVKKRDRRKRSICEERAVVLIEIDYTEPLTREHIAQRIAEAGVPIPG